MHICSCVESLPYVREHRLFFRYAKIDVLPTPDFNQQGNYISRKSLRTRLELAYIETKPIRMKNSPWPSHQSRALAVRRDGSTATFTHFAERTAKRMYPAGIRAHQIFEAKMVLLSTVSIPGALPVLWTLLCWTNWHERAHSALC